MKGRACVVSFVGYRLAAHLRSNTSLQRKLNFSFPLQLLWLIHSFAVTHRRRRAALYSLSAKKEIEQVDWLNILISLQWRLIEGRGRDEIESCLGRKLITQHPLIQIKDLIEGANNTNQTHLHSLFNKTKVKLFFYWKSEDKLDFLRDWK